MATMQALRRWALLELRSGGNAFNSFGLRQMSTKNDMIKQLREETGAPIQEVKRALDEEGADKQAAFENLRKRGIAAAAKKEGKPAAEGLVSLASSSDGSTAALAEVNCETDFSARYTGVQELCRAAAETAQGGCGGDGVTLLDRASLGALRVSDGRSISDAASDVAGDIRENVVPRRAACLKAPERGIVAGYVHHPVAPGVGTLAAAVVLRTDGGDNRSHEELKALAKSVAMHVAAMRPSHVSRGDVPREEVDRERAIVEEQARGSGKPDHVVKKMVDGRLDKLFKERCLQEQAFVVEEGNRSVKDALGHASVVDFVRFQLGEVSESRGSDFAGEVASMLKGET